MNVIVARRDNHVRFCLDKEGDIIHSNFGRNSNAATKLCMDLCYNISSVYVALSRARYYSGKEGEGEAERRENATVRFIGFRS